MGTICEMTSGDSKVPGRLAWGRGRELEFRFDTKDGHGKTVETCEGDATQREGGRERSHLDLADPAAAPDYRDGARDPQRPPWRAAAPGGGAEGSGVLPDGFGETDFRGRVL